MAGELQLITSFNPISKANWVYKKWFDTEAIYDRENTTIIKTTYKDNKFLPESYIKALEEKQFSNPLYFQVYALGDFATAEGLVITNWRIDEFNPMELAAKGLEHRSGIDLGFIDKTAIIDTLYDRERKIIYVFNEFYRSGCQLSEIASAMEQMNLRKTKIYVDSAEPRSIQFFKNEGFNAVAANKGKDSVKAGLMFLQDCLIVVLPSCINFITELQNFSYIKSKKTGEWTEETTHEFSHAIDACRYAYSDIYTNKEVKILSKSAFGL